MTMRVYWIEGKRKLIIKYHNTFSLEHAIRLARALESCGIARIWIEAGLAHKAIVPATSSGILADYPV